MFMFGEFGVMILFFINIAILALIVYIGYKMYVEMDSNAKSNAKYSASFIKFIRFSRISILSLWICFCFGSLILAIFMYFSGQAKFIESLSILLVYPLYFTFLCLLLFSACMFIAHIANKLVLAKGGVFAIITLATISLIILLGMIIGGFVASSGIPIFMGFALAVINFCLFGYAKFFG